MLASPIDVIMLYLCRPLKHTYQINKGVLHFQDALPGKKLTQGFTKDISFRCPLLLSKQFYRSILSLCI